MAERFVDRQSTYPNRYKITKEDGNAEYVTIERADNPTVLGTPLTADVFNAIIAELNNKISGDGPIILKEGVHYGDTLPNPGTPGRIFFKKVNE